MNIRFFLTACAVFALCAAPLAGQNSKASLQSRKTALQKEMSRLNEAIARNDKNQKSNTVQLQSLRNRTRVREEMIKNINTDIGMLDVQIDSKSGEAERLSKELDTLKASYSRMCVNYYRNKAPGMRLMYILSSSSLLQAYRRGKYIEEYAGAIRLRGENVRSKNEETRRAIEELKKLRQEKGQLLAEQASEMEKLKKDQARIQNILNSLKKNKKQLQQELTAKKKTAERIQKEIDDIIARELAAQNKKNTAAGKKKSSEIELTPEGRILSANFAQNKGRLPWPVERGDIYMRFGNQPYPGTNVYITVPGLDISAPQGSYARAVFDGQVTRVQVKDGLYMVFVSHGKYYTIYSNLSAVNVKSGDKISVKQKIGTIYTDRFEGKTILTFCIYDGGVKQDPEQWLAR